MAKRSVNKADVARKTGLSTYRLSQLSINSRSHLRVEELYLIALAINVQPNELLEFVCKDFKLPENSGS
ncbi:helix-turn-helix domain-containing protein [Mucilaginibacter rubeus]|uniref:helix-turn-helix domain-containing protein n=1 Tax=Mucilaginibacter rubeus TaxID=2027860 RepID=UPI001FB58396